MAFVDEEQMDEMDLGYAAESVKKEVTVYPAGDYPVVIEKAFLKMNEKQDIKSANIVMTITAGEYERRKIFARHAIATTRQGRRLDSGEDSMQVMVRIGKEQLGELFRAVGVGGSSLAPLVGKEGIVRLAVRPAHDQYDESNDVKGYKPKAGRTVVRTGKATLADSKAAAKAPAFMNKKAPTVPQPVEDDEAEDEIHRQALNDAKSINVGD